MELRIPDLQWYLKLSDNSFQGSILEGDTSQVNTVHTCLRVRQFCYSFRVVSESTHIDSLLSKAKSYMMPFFLAINVDVLLDLLLNYLGT